MITKSHRGEIALTLILLLALGGGVGTYLWGRSDAKMKQAKEVAELNTRTAKAEQAAKEAAKNQQEAAESHTKAIESQRLKEQAAAGFVAGTGFALDSDAPSDIKIKVAKALNEDAAKTLEAPTKEQVAQYKEIIKDLLARNETTSKALVAKEQEASLLASEATTAKQAAIAADAKAAASAAQTVVATAEANDQAKKITELTANNESLTAQLKKIAIIAGSLWLASIVLPLLAKSFPTLQPIASTFGALWAPGMQAVASGAKALSTDLVAMHEYVKGELTKDLAPEKIAALKTKLKDWWGSDHKSQFDIARIKENTLRA